MDHKAQGGAPRDDIVRLMSRRFVISSEVKDGARLAESLVKTLFGGDQMAARGLYQTTLEFTPRFKLVIAANHRPRARDDDEALWRRIVEVPFDVSIPEAERDPAVKATLCDPAEAGAAILAWAVDGAARYFEDRLGIPAPVRAATAGYRQSMDPLREFFADRCVFEEFATVAAGELRAAYEAWAKENGTKYALNGNTFAERIKAKGCESTRLGHDRIRGWRGLRLRTAADADSADGADVTSVTSPYARAHERSYETDVRGVRGVRTQPEALRL